MQQKPELETKRPTPRRLFSFDAIKPSSTRRSAADPPNDQEKLKHGLGQLKTTGLSQIQEPTREKRTASENAAADNWTEKPMVESPPPTDSASSFRTWSPAPDSASSRQASVPLRSTTPDSQLRHSHSRARWDHLRQHVLPHARRPATPPVPSQPTSASSQALSFARSTTPKPSRLARLGFRHVVDQARVVDDTRKFAAEVIRACWFARYTEPNRVKGDKDISATSSSSLYLPFMSTTSVSTAGVSSMHATGGSKKNELRRPPSAGSLATAFRAVPSLKLLHQVLLHHSTAPPDGIIALEILPHENYVLSTILCSFLTPQKAPNVEEEQRLAIQIFDIVINTWPSDESSGVERALFCCKAALVPSQMRTRLLGYLWRILAPGELTHPVVAPRVIQTISQGLFTLLASLHPRSGAPTNIDDVRVMKDLITKFLSGSYGEFDESSLQEEYAAAREGEKSNSLRAVIVVEGLLSCLENCTQDTRIWLLEHALQEYWLAPSPGDKFTPLLTAIHSRKISAFSRVSLSLLLSETLEEKLKILMTQHIARLLQTRMLPESEAMRGKYALDTKDIVIRLVLELLCIENARDVTRWGISLVCYWYNDSPDWKQHLEKSFQQILASGDWSASLRILCAMVKVMPADTRRPMFTFLLPILNDQLVKDPPAYPFPPLSSLLETLSHLYPQIFYKPLFGCAASSKEFTVVNHLCILAAHSKFVPDYWVRDPEMMSVALMSDAGARKETLKTNLGGPPWAKARLGQSMLLVELTGRIQAIRREKEASSGSEASYSDIIKFATTLEARIAVLLEVKERTALIPPSQRMLFCILLREFRLLTRSLKNASWLQRVTTWLTDFYTEDDLGGEIQQEVSVAMGQIQGMYRGAQEGLNQTNTGRSTVLSMALNAAPGLDSGLNATGSFAANKYLIDSLSKGFPVKVMKLLVAMSSLMTAEEYRKMGPVLWQQGMENMNLSTTATVCFLLMQCAEKAPLDLLAIIEVDLQTYDDTTRLEAVRKIAILINWRFHILSQNVVADRAHRPFKLARAALPFVPTDIGSTLYVHEEDPAESNDSMPLELKRRLAEIGWAEDDTPMDQRQEWIRTPMSLLPANQLDRLDPTTVDQSLASPLPPDLSPRPSPRRSPSPSGRPDEVGLLRRNSSSGGPAHGVKRKAIFVPTLASVFPRLAFLVFDPNFAVASAARNTIFDLMRNDPGLLTRPILDLFSGDHKDVAAAVSTFTALLHIRRMIPPPMAHNIFNNLTGFLKLAARQADHTDTLQDYAHIIPILAKLVNQVSGMSIREIRRAKLESFVIPSGSLWFPSSAPTGPMFPRSPGHSRDPFDNLLARLVSITMIRVSQNMLFLSMLKRNHQDVQLIRKNMTRLVLPSKEDTTDARPLEMKDFVPHKPQPANTSESTSSDGSIKVLSLMLSRSYLLLVAQVFRSMSRHLNDRNELAVLVDGLNRILLTHGDDIGIVSQAMIAYMVASTRFRRLFTSGGGYTLFMPAVVKVYTEYSPNPGIKLAIEYAVNRFHALHRESFLFQSLESVARIFVLRNIDHEWFAKGVYDLFFSLNKGITSATPDAAGIHNVNKKQEREALIVTTAEEKPQTFLESVRRTESHLEGEAPIELPEEYESSRLGMDNFVRLFLTVIAHDPSVVRAEHFLRLLRFLTPHLYHSSSSARSIVQEGIGALCIILSKSVSKPKATDGPSARPAEESISFLGPLHTVGSQLPDKAKGASDSMSMRLDYLSLILGFGRVGGLVSLPTARQVLELVKLMLKDITSEASDAISTFFAEFVQSLLLRDERPSAKAVVAFLRELAPILHMYVTTIDFTGVFETVTQLARVPTYANEPMFAQVVVAETCTAGLVACEFAASEHQLFTLPCRSAVVSLLAESVLLRGADVIAELEKRTASYAFLAGVVLPVVFAIKSDTQLAPDSALVELSQRKALASAWIRLLFYSITACQRSLHKRGDRSKTKDKGRSAEIVARSQLSIFLAALQVIKAIVVRAETELSTNLPGIWERVASFFRSMLADGNAEFALRSEYSTFASPISSPRSSSQFDFSIQSDLRRSQSSHERPFSRPRMIDYAVWSLFELLCAYRGPLRLQLRLFTMEKVVTLDQELRHRQIIQSPFQTPTTGRPLSASVFSKPRGRSSSFAPSPNASPRLSAVQSNSLETSPSLLDIRKPGYQISPITPSVAPGNFLRPKIVHLGPTTPSMLTDAPPSPGGGGRSHFTTYSANIRSLVLIHATYRRIRMVQAFLGYDVLLPLPQNTGLVDNDVLKTWTMRQALDAIMQETVELVEEFEESSGEEDSVMVEIERMDSH